MHLVQWPQMQPCEWNQVQVNCSARVKTGSHASFHGQKQLWQTTLDVLTIKHALERQMDQAPDIAMIESWKRASWEYIGLKPGTTLSICDGDCMQWLQRLVSNMTLLVSAQWPSLQKGNVHASISALIVLSIRRVAKMTMIVTTLLIMMKMTKGICWW